MARRVARVALLDCEDASKWSDHLDVWREALAGDDKSSSEELEWTRYKACQGELPTAAALENFDAIVVPGSHHSAVVPADGQHPPWMQAVMDVIRGVVARGHPQLFAACFGHQLLAATLGGRVDHGGQFVFKAENIELQARPWSAWVVRVSAVWTTTKNRSARASMRVTTLRGLRVLPSLRFSELCARHSRVSLRSLDCVASWRVGGVCRCSRATAMLSRSSHPELSGWAAPLRASMRSSALAKAFCRFKDTLSFRWRC